MVREWDAVAAALGLRRRVSFGEWMFAEGIARYWESAWENAARDGDPDDLRAFRVPQ